VKTPARIVVGFALETTEGEACVREKDGRTGQEYRNEARLRHGDQAVANAEQPAAGAQERRAEHRADGDRPQAV